MCGQFSWLSLYFYLINFIAKHRQAGKLSWHPSLPCPHAKPLPACLPACCCLSHSQSSSSFQHLDNDLLSQPAEAQHSQSGRQSWDRQGTEQGQSRSSASQPASLAILFVKWPFLFASASAPARERGLLSARMWANIACKSIHFARTQVEPAAAKVT